MEYRFDKLKGKALITASFMFGLIFAIGTALVWYFALPVYYVFIVTFTVVLLQYLLSPELIDIIFAIEYENSSNYLSFAVKEFIEEACSKSGIRVPTIGIIRDGSPNAFTFGYSRRFAKIAITTGLLEFLTEDEQKAVIAHEIGHIKHNDFILMMVISLIPILMYQIYIWTVRSDKGNPAYWIGIGAYAAYLLSQYFSLFFSRLREYYADNFAKNIMKEGSSLKSALIKVAYGYASLEKSKRPVNAAFAFTNGIQNEAFALVNMNNKTNMSIEDKLLNWDIKSIWGKWYALNSTHPLTAKRILALEERYIYEKKTNTSEVKHFIKEVFIAILPWAIALLIGISNRDIIAESGIVKGIITIVRIYPLLIAILGASILLKYYYSYRSDFSSYSIKELLANECASPVRGIPAIIEGKVIGKGIPGLFYSEDMVVDDGTSIMLIDYRQPMRVFEILFGIFKADQLQQKNVKVLGWYKRGNKPYFCCKHIIDDNKKYISYSYVSNMLSGYVMLLIGILLYILT